MSFGSGLLLSAITSPDGSIPAAALILCTLLCTAVGYLLGGLNFATILSKKLYHDDIRNYGSKNAGSTNMMRTYGTKAALLTLLGDVLKGVVSVFVGGLLLGVTIGGYASALGCVLGHVFPLYFGFKGGKGVATAAGAILLLHPLVFLCVVGVFVLTVVFSRYISLGSVLAAAVFPLLTFYTLFYARVDSLIAGSGFAFLCAFAIAVIVIVKHHENLSRLAHGKESKFAFKKSGK